MSSLDLDLLKAFAAIIDTGSFTRAGERLGLTQSAITLKLRRLEAQAGVETRLPVAVAAAPALPDPAQPKAGTLTTPRRKRRAYTPNFMRD